MAATIEIMENKVQKTAKSSTEQAPERLNHLVRIGNDLATEAFLKQKEYILKNINGKTLGLSKLAEQIMALEKPHELAEGQHESVNEIRKHEGFERSLRDISVLNVKLFVNLNAYKDFLADAKDGVAKQFPNPTDASRVERERQIDDLAKEIGKVAKAANMVMRNIAESKERDLYKVSMSENDVGSLRKDMLDIKDDSGRSLSARLGTDLVRFENSPPRSVQERIVNDSIEIVERLPKQDKEFLNRLMVIGGSMLSVDIVKELSMISINLYAYSKQDMACQTGPEGQDAARKDASAKADIAWKAAEDATPLSESEIHEMISTVSRNGGSVADDAVPISHEEVRNLMGKGLKRVHRNADDAVQSDKPVKQTSTTNGFDTAYNVDNPENIPAEELLRKAGKHSDEKANSITGEPQQKGFQEDNTEAVLEPLSFMTIL